MNRYHKRLDSLVSNPNSSERRNMLFRKKTDKGKAIVHNINYTKNDLGSFANPASDPGYYIVEPKASVEKVDYMDLCYFCSICKKPMMRLGRKEKLELYQQITDKSKLICNSH